MPNTPNDPNLNTPVPDTATGTAADVEAVMRKYDRESNTRVWMGTPRISPTFHGRGTFGLIDILGTKEQCHCNS